MRKPFFSSLLERLGLVEFGAGQGHGNARAPIVPYDEMDLTTDLKSLAKRKAA